MCSFFDAQAAEDSKEEGGGKRGHERTKSGGGFSDGPAPPATATTTGGGGGGNTRGKRDRPADERDTPPDAGKRQRNAPAPRDGEYFPCCVSLLIQNPRSLTCLFSFSLIQQGVTTDATVTVVAGAPTIDPGPT